MHKVLEAIASRLRNCRACWFTDNQTVAHLFLVGSRKGHWQLELINNHVHILTKLSKICWTHNIKVIVQTLMLPQHGTT